jgi:putative membrane protein
MKALSLTLMAVSSLTFGLAAAQTSGPSDAQNAGIVVAANQIDVDAGKLAMERSRNKEVQSFAQQMITDHTAVNQQASALVRKLKVQPEKSDTSRSLYSGARVNIENLKKLNGAEFDRAYVDHEVTYHQAVLDALDKTLIPSARNGELKALLVKVRPAIGAHLDHAKQLQSALGRR